MRFNPRKRLLVDPKVQKALLFRAVIYWAFSVVTVSLVIMCLQVALGPPGPFLAYFRIDQLWQQYGIVLIASAMVLPILLVDLLNISNRFAGPLYRMRRSMRALAAGEFVTPLKFRDNDFWQEVASEFNALAAYVEQLKQQAQVNQQLASIPDEQLSETSNP